MRMIHCADLHLDSKLSAHLSADKRRERRGELLHSFRRMIQFGKEQQVEAVLIAGDLFDTAAVSETAVNTVRQIITDNPEISFYYLKGNHDNLAIFHEADEILDNLKLFSDKWQYYNQPCKKGQIVIAGVELQEDNKENLLGSLYLHPDSVNIVMLHGQKSEYRGTDSTAVIPIRELRHQNIDYLALGHVHSFQADRLDARGIWCYSGCLEGRGFDECGEHGFVLLEIDEETGICEPQFIPFSCRNLYTVYVDVTGCGCTEEMGNRIEQILEKEKPETKDMLKIVLTGRIDFGVEKNLYVLKKRIEDQYYYVKLCDETSLAVDYKKYLTDESLKGEFIRLISRAEEISEEDKAVLIRYGFQLLAGEEIQ